MGREESRYAVKDNFPDAKAMLFSQLVALMEKQAQSYDSMRSALRDEKERIINIDLQGLAETDQRKQSLLGKIGRLEEDRINLMKDFSKILKISIQGLTVRKLMAYTRGEDKDRLSKSREALLDLAGEIRRMNQFNKLLISHSLELIVGSYSFLSHLAAPDTVYHSSGGLRLRHQSGKFISDDI
jgi:flagellar biosynthesis/type III secretory pathway chaperone